MLGVKLFSCLHYWPMVSIGVYWLQVWGLPGARWLGWTVKFILRHN